MDITVLESDPIAFPRGSCSHIDRIGFVFVRLATMGDGIPKGFGPCLIGQDPIAIDIGRICVRNEDIAVRIFEIHGNDAKMSLCILSEIFQ